jgi:hypothetical protein
MNQDEYDRADLTFSKKKLLHSVRKFCGLSYKQQKQQGEKM